MRDSNVGLIGDITNHISKRLHGGWMIFYGPSDYYKSIEYTYYPPGTPENKNFELLSGGFCGKIITICLGKKEGKILDVTGKDDIKNLIAWECFDKKEIGYLSLDLRKKGKISMDSFIADRIALMFINLEFEIKTGIHLPSIFERPKFETPETKKSNKKGKKRNHISKSIRHEVFKRDDYKCVECGATKEKTTLHIDHILPVSQGGTDELDNLQTLCEECNLAKSSRKWKGGNNEN
ncbi:MAG: HNH endonuclease [Methanobacterium sp.]